MSHRPWKAPARIAVALALLAAAVGGSAPPSGARLGGGILWADRGLHVVGGPVAAGGRVVVVVSAKNKALWLEGIDPASGKLAWKVPYSYSAITAGVASDPVVVGGIALALLPEAAFGGGGVDFAGVDVATGTKLWRSVHPVLVTDQPTKCPEPLLGTAFCVTIAAATNSFGLVAISPSTGKALAAVNGIERLISTPPGLYQIAAVHPTFSQLQTPGGIRWSKRVAALFGSASYSPDNGWDVDRYGPLDVGSVGAAPSNKVLSLAKTLTVAFEAKTGKVVWRDPGEFQCGSGLLDVRFICLMTGTATFAHGTILTSRGATLTLEGFDRATGKITWRLRVTDFAGLLLGEAPIRDSTHLAVTIPSGKKRVLDLTNGTTAAVAPGTVFWCQKENEFAVKPASGQSPGRIGVYRYATCDARGNPVGGVGAASSAVGANVGTAFVWASPAGLQATGTTGIA